MKIFPSSVIKELDAYTIENEPVASIDLMERAATAITQAITRQWDQETPVIVFAGPGNNGGDALAVARLLSLQKYDVEVYLFNTTGKLSPDCQANKELVEKMADVTFHEIMSEFNPPKLDEDYLVIDGLFGSGLNKPLTGGYAAVVRYINASMATIVAIDIPSGLMGEDNSANNPDTIIHAHYTFSLQLPKLSFLFAENERFVGKWELLDIQISREAIEEHETPFYLSGEEDIRPLVKPRKKFAHKGDFGHAMLIAGSYGMAGSSILAARACLRSGAGLLTVHAPARNNNILQVAVPEAMVEPDIHEEVFAYPTETSPYNALGVGPGLGKSKETEAALMELIRNCNIPMVIDADALNILARNRQTLAALPGNSILTPHPKELERLVGECKNSYERLCKACQLAIATKVHIVLKGAYSAVITPQGDCFFNPTGNAGMATAGSGDVLTGVILALLAQGYPALEAARTGTYVHGRAGDLAGRRYGLTAMTAGDIVEYLPEAWKELE